MNWRTPQARAGVFEKGSEAHGIHGLWRWRRGPPPNFIISLCYYDYILTQNIAAHKGIYKLAVPRALSYLILYH